MHPERQLHVEFETHTALIRRFIEKHFGRAALPDRTAGKAADLLLVDGDPLDIRSPVAGVWLDGVRVV